MKIYLLVALVILLSGCATRPQLTREEWVGVTTREYEERTPAQVLAAAEKLFRLADGDDFTIAHAADGLSATRGWAAFFIIGGANGTDYWTVRAAPGAKGTVATVQASTQSTTIAPMMIGGIGMIPAALPGQGAPIDGTALYDVFWARMDYLLGRRPAWMTCEEADERVRKSVTWGSNEALCNSFNLADETPKEPLFR